MPGALTQARAVMRLHPDAAADAARAAADPRTPRDTAGVLTSALAGAGTDATRAALIGLTRSDDAQVRLMAVRSMTMLANPDEESITTLTSLLSDQDPAMATAAGLALGANVGQSGGAAGGQANAAGVEALIARYNAASDDATRAPLVLALGNAGGPEVLPVMLDALTRSTPVAADAAYGLRDVPGAAVDQLFDALLRSGATPVRVQAVRAVLVRDRAAWLPKLTAMLDGELPDDVRKAIEAAL
jgi:HEAT repeat protein